MSSIRTPFKKGLRGLPSHDRWLLSYADFVTLLLAVFIVLFAALRHSHGSIRTVSTAIQSGFEVLGVGSAPPHTPHNVGLSQTQKTGALPGNAGELAHQLQEVLGDAIHKHEVIVEPRADGLTVRLQELGFFESGNAVLLPEAAEKLQRTARVLEQYKMELRVEGHSDNHPINTTAFHSNWELSTARAMNVLTVLVDQAGFPPDRIAVTGYGPYRPIADNATEEGRRANRRVDLVIVIPNPQQDTAR